MVILNASSTPVETLDYYPYGNLKLDTALGGYDGESRKYIGQQYDPSSGLSYLNARYYDSTRGQFLSQDPIFLSSSQHFGDPQSLNSYSYSEDNPISKEDPNSKYVEISAAGTYMGWSGAVGFDASTRGLNFFVAGGAGVGTAGFPVSLSYTPGDVSHTMDTTVAVGGDAAYYFGGGASYSGTYAPQTVSLDNGSMQYFLQAGLGADAYVRKQVSIPILGGVRPNLPLVSTSNFSTPNYQGSISATSYPVFTSVSTVTKQTQTNMNTGGYGSVYINPSTLFTTPSGAVVNWSGALVSGPKSK